MPLVEIEPLLPLILRFWPDGLLMDMAPLPEPVADRELFRVIAGVVIVALLADTGADTVIG